jgi:hypothetical protein
MRKALGTTWLEEDVKKKCVGTTRGGKKVTEKKSSRLGAISGTEEWEEECFSRRRDDEKAFSDHAGRKQI